MIPPLYGLVLAGGRSNRMGQDKALLAYHGGTQLDWGMALIKPLVERAFISVRSDQTNEPVRTRYNQIVDTLDDAGPIAGIVAAQASFPHAAWLVLACDLPFLEAETLHHLIAHRSSSRSATAYRSSHDGLPEPLCAIYEPASREALAAYVQSGGRCPRKFLMQHDVEILQELNPRALDNINTPLERDEATTRLSPHSQTDPISITVQYFALLRDQAKCREESVSTAARNPKELYQELKQRHGFTLSPDVLRIAVNAEFGSWEQPLNKGDSVVFIPPVAGG